MHSGGVKELRLAVGLAVVEATKHELASAHQRAQIKIGASLGIILGVMLHHVLIGLVGGIGIPVVGLAIRAVPHGILLFHRWRREQRRAIAFGQELLVLLLIGITD